MNLIEAKNISKFFGTQTVFRSLNLRIAAGQCLLIHGPNGCGKSTLLRCLAGLMKPEEGSIALGGEDVWRASGFAKARTKLRIGYLPTQSLLFPSLRVAEHFVLYSQLLGFNPEQAFEMGRRLELTPHFDKRAEHCSQGTIRKLGICRALLGNPRIVLLDEPFANLDDASILAVQRALILQRESGAAMVIASHQSEDQVGLFTERRLLAHPAAGRPVPEAAGWVHG